MELYAFFILNENILSTEK